MDEAFKRPVTFRLTDDTVSGARDSRMEGTLTAGPAEAKRPFAERLE